MLTLKRFRRIEAAVRAAGYGDSILWAETIAAPVDAHAFAEAAVYVICNSGMRTTVALVIYDRCMGALRRGQSSATVFGHVGKAGAIDLIWNEREELFAAFNVADDKVAFCATLPWIGPITKNHLAKNFGVDTAKADVHLQRLANVEKITAHKLCARLAAQSGYRAATVDTILWRACTEGILDSKRYEANGWHGSFQPPNVAA